MSEGRRPIPKAGEQLELGACIGVLHTFLGCIYLSLLEDLPSVHRRERDGSLLCQ